MRSKGNQKKICFNVFSQRDSAAALSALALSYPWSSGGKSGGASQGRLSIEEGLRPASEI